MHTYLNHRMVQADGGVGGFALAPGTNRRLVSLLQAFAGALVDDAPYDVSASTAPPAATGCQPPASPGGSASSDGVACNCPPRQQLRLSLIPSDDSVRDPSRRLAERRRLPSAWRIAAPRLVEWIGDGRGKEGSVLSP